MFSNSKKLSEDANFFSPNMSATCLLIFSLFVGHTPKASCLQSVPWANSRLMSFALPVFTYRVRNSLIFLTRTIFHFQIPLVSTFLLLVLSSIPMHSKLISIPNPSSPQKPSSLCLQYGLGTSTLLCPPLSPFVADNSRCTFQFYFEHLIQIPDSLPQITGDALLDEFHVHANPNPEFDEKLKNTSHGFLHKGGTDHFESSQIAVMVAVGLQRYGFQTDIVRPLPFYDGRGREALSPSHQGWEQSYRSFTCEFLYWHIWAISWPSQPHGAAYVFYHSTHLTNPMYPSEGSSPF